jgi:hypothetical protein
MLMLSKFYHLVFLLFTSLSLLVAIPSQAMAGIVTTEEIVQAKQSENARKHLDELLQREDVQQALAARGVDVAAARQRVASMTDAEIQTIAASIDKLPAGGRQLSHLELILLIIILILLI